MTILERRLHRMELTIGRGQSFDGANARAGRLHRENGARLDRDAVDEHRARSALAGVASDMRAGEAQILANEFDQQRARVDLGVDFLAVDGKR